MELFPEKLTDDFPPNGSREEIEYTIDRDPYKVAEEIGGLQVVEANDNHLQIDLDSGDVNTLVDRVNLLVKLGIVPFAPDAANSKVTFSKSGNLHAYVKLSEGLAPEERVILQLFLGSDPIRELFNYLRLKRSVPRPGIVLFETEENYADVKRFIGTEDEGTRPVIDLVQTLKDSIAKTEAERTIGVEEEDAAPF